MNRKLAALVVSFLCISAFSMSTSQVKASSSPPVAYWRFDEVSGTIANDSSGNGNTGTVFGAQWVDGKQGKALRFDGLNDYVSIRDSSSLDISGNQISIEFWMKPTVDLPVSGASMYIFDKGDSYLGIMPAETTGGDAPNYGKLEFAFPFSNFNPVDTYSTTHFWAANTWYHIAFTCDGNVFRVYVNSALESTVANTGNVHPSGFSLVIGSRVSGDQEFFKGIIDEFAIYNYARTAEDILNDYNPQIPLWMQWWFWTTIALGAIVVVLAFTTVHYRKKPSVSKETSVMQSKTTQRANKICPKCGANLPAYSKFCGKCGTSLE